MARRRSGSLRQLGLRENITTIGASKLDVLGVWHRYVWQMLRDSL